MGTQHLCTQLTHKGIGASSWTKLLPLNLKSALIHSLIVQSAYKVVALCSWCIHSLDFIILDLTRRLPSLGCPSRLGCCSKTSDASEPPVWEGCLRSVSSSPMTALGCDAQDSKSPGGMSGPAAFPLEEASILFFVHSCTTFAPVSALERLCSPHSLSQGLPLRPPTHTCKSRSQGIRFILGLRAGEEGRSPVHTLPLPPPLSCLPCRWVSVKGSLCFFPGVETWSTNGACGVGGCLNASQFLVMTGK